MFAKPLLRQHTCDYCDAELDVDSQSGRRRTLVMAVLATVNGRVQEGQRQFGESTVGDVEVLVELQVGVRSLDDNVVLLQLNSVDFSVVDATAYTRRSVRYDTHLSTDR
jgi:hypothetical protein